MNRLSERRIMRDGNHKSLAQFEIMESFFADGLSNAITLFGILTMINEDCV